MDRRAWTLLLILSAIWGASYMLIKIGIRDFSPAMVAFLRVALGGGGPARPRRQARRAGRLSGLIADAGRSSASIQVAGPFLLIAAGQQEITSSLAGILVTSAPLFTALLAIWVDQEERSQGAAWWASCSVSPASSCCWASISADRAASCSAGSRSCWRGSATRSGASRQAAGSRICRRSASRPGSSPRAPCCSPRSRRSASRAGPRARAGRRDRLLGVVGTGIAFAILYELFATVGPSRAWIVTYLAPGFAVVYGAALLDEQITVATMAGLALILTGSYLAAEGRNPLRGRVAPPRRAERTRRAAGRYRSAAELVPERVEGR